MKAARRPPAGAQPPAADRPCPPPGLPRLALPRQPAELHPDVFEDERFKLSHLRVYGYLESHSFGYDAIWHLNKTIAAAVHLTERAVADALADLEIWGFVRRCWQRFRGKVRRIIFLLWRLDDGAEPRISPEPDPESDAPHPEAPFIPGTVVQPPPEAPFIPALNGASARSNAEELNETGMEKSLTGERPDGEERNEPEPAAKSAPLSEAERTQYRAWLKLNDWRATFARTILAGAGELPDSEFLPAIAEPPAPAPPAAAPAGPGPLAALFDRITAPAALGGSQTSLPPLTPAPAPIDLAAFRQLADDPAAAAELASRIAARLGDRKPRTLQFWAGAFGEVRAGKVTPEILHAAYRDATAPEVEHRARAFSKWVAAALRRVKKPAVGPLAKVPHGRRQEASPSADPIIR